MTATGRTVARDAAVLTAAPVDTVHDHGPLVIEDGRLAEVRPAEQDDGGEPADTVIDGRGRPAPPGLVHAHTHLEMSGVQGAFSDLSTLRLVMETTTPFRRSGTCAEPERVGRALGLISTPTSGITLFTSMDRDPGLGAEAGARSGMRAVMGPIPADLMLPESVEVQVARAEEVVAAYRRPHAGGAVVIALFCPVVLVRWWSGTQRRRAHRLRSHCLRPAHADVRASAARTRPPGRRTAGHG